MTRMARTPRRHGLALALLAAALLAGCATRPSGPGDYVVLLEEANGSVGHVVYTGAQGTAELKQAREAVALRGPAVPFTLDAEQLHRDAGAAMAAQPVAPRTFVLYFDAGTARITKASEVLLPQILQEVRNRPMAELAIVGHTDTVGSAALNASLSLRRAQEVGQLLAAARAAAVAVDITSHGEHNLLVRTPDDTAEPRNRRVEVTVR